jgi:hypothetical protein
MTIHDQTPQDNPQDREKKPTPTWLDTATPQQLGLAGELLVMDMLTANGYLVEVAHGYDLTAGSTETHEIKKVEVKTARMSADGSYQFVLAKEGHTDHRRAEWLVLLCVTPDGEIFTYVVPVSAAMLQTKITIPTDPRKYRGHWQMYRQSAPGMLVLE